MNRTGKATEAMKALYGEPHIDLTVTDPEFAAIKERLIYGEVYAEAKLRELIILATLTVCLPCIGFPRTLNALGCINEVLPETK